MHNIKQNFEDIFIIVKHRLDDRTNILGVEPLKFDSLAPKMLVSVFQVKHTYEFNMKSKIHTYHILKMTISKHISYKSCIVMFLFNAGSSFASLTRK